MHLLNAKDKGAYDVVYTCKSDFGAGEPHKNVHVQNRRCNFSGHIFLNGLYRRSHQPWRVSDPAPVEPNCNPGLSSSVALSISNCCITAYCGPLPLYSHPNTYRNHCPCSGSPLTLQHVGKLFQDEQQQLKSSSQSTQASAPRESIERTLTLLNKGKQILPCMFLLSSNPWDPKERISDGGREEKFSQLAGSNISLACHHNGALYHCDTEDVVTTSKEGVNEESFIYLNVS